MSNINTKTLKMIKKFAKLRGEGNPSLKEDILIEVFEKANSFERKKFKKEMQEYFRVIDKGLIKAGQPVTEAYKI